MIGGIASRAESGDVSGAATDVAGLIAAENAPAIARGVGKVVRKVPIPDIVLEWLKKIPETPTSQHGTPVTVESPLDSATLSKQLGGKDLSPEALKTLQQHVGDKIPVGSTANNMPTKAVEPVTKTITDTASKMNDVVKDAQPFQQSVTDDGKVLNTFDQLEKNMPPSVRKALTEDVDGVLQDNQLALVSKNPAEVLEQRHLLGKQIDWDDIVINPSTPAEVQNLARVKAYRILGDKIHAEIPETAPLDKILRPNLELRSHMTSKLGERVVNDPIAATVEHQTELNKGRTTVENKIHNDKVTRNRAIALAALSAAGAGTVGGTVVKHVLP